MSDPIDLSVPHLFGRLVVELEPDGALCLSLPESSLLPEDEEDEWFIVPAAALPGLRRFIDAVLAEKAET